MYRGQRQGTDGQPKSEEKLKLWLKKKTCDGSQAAKVGIQRLQIPFSAKFVQISCPTRSATLKTLDIARL